MNLNHSENPVQAILDFLSSLESGDFSKCLSRSQEPNIFSPIIDKLNQFRKTLQVQAENAIAQGRYSEIFFRAMIDSPKEIMVFALDRDFRYLAFNPSHKQTMKAIWGFDIERGMNMLNVIRNESDRKKAQKNFERALSGDHFVLTEKYGDSALKRHFWEDIYSPIYDEEQQIIGLTVYAIDITERKQAENELIASRAAVELAKNRTIFLDLAAHELRNPVAAMSVLLQLVQKQTEKGQPINPTMIARLRDPVNRLTHLVVDLLDVSRLERGLMLLRPVPGNIVALISNGIDEFQLRFPKRRFSFIKPHQIIEFHFDPVRISQVFSNLLDNASKFTPDNSLIEITVASLPSVIRVSVMDCGPGIPKAQVATLFDAFSRGSSGAVIRSSGLGLGLSICRGIMEQHGGTIGVASEQGQGSCFYFEFPKKGS